MSQTFDLGGVWELKNLNTLTCIRVSVPGGILNDYLVNGLIDDPFYRDNEYKTYDLFRDDFQFSRKFVIGSGFNKKTDLVCDGIDTLSTIYINGIKIAETSNMHTRYRFAADHALHEGENEIIVIIHSPVRFIEEQWGKSENVWGVCAKDGYQFIRKAHYMFGWDWGPALPDGGIWRGIRLEARGRGRIGDIDIRQTHSKDKVSLDVRTEIFADNVIDMKAGVRITDPDGAVLYDDGFGEDGSAAIEINNPKLWWPNGYGDQPLYSVDVILAADGETVDEKTLKTGLRTFEISRERDRWGREFAYKVNGVRIFAMGANYIPEDNILARCTRERTQRLLQSAVEANFNTLRVWGGGIYPEDYFFELCDEYGLLVWQDFMFACAQYGLDDDQFVESIKEEVADNIKRLKHHPSVALWCGNNEMEWIWTNEQTQGATKEQKEEYLVLFEKIIPPVVERWDPDRFYWPSSPSSGGGFEDPNNENDGDVHYWEVWHGLKPFTDYRNFYFRFCSEFGFQSFPCMKTIESYTLPKDRNIFSRIMESHQKNSGANGKILYYLSENFKYPKDLNSLAYVSQLLQAEAIRYGVEHWRRNRGRCMGSIYWQFNDCWPVASWSSIDVFHRWKALHYFAKRFYSPVMLSIHDEGLNVSMVVSNETRGKIHGELAWRLVMTDGTVMASGGEHAAVDELESRKILDLDFTEQLSDAAIKRKTVLHCTYECEKGLSENTLMFVPSKYFEYTNPSYNISCKDNADSYILEIKSDVFAGYVELQLDNCVFGDNYFHLMPGEPKQIRIEKAKNKMNMSCEQLSESIAIRSIYDTY